MVLSSPQKEAPGAGGRRKKKRGADEGRKNEWKYSAPEGADRTLILDNQLFRDYYEKLWGEEKEAVLASLRTALPACIRVCGSRPLHRSISGYLKRMSAAALGEATLEDQVTKLDSSNVTAVSTPALASALAVSQIPWYPNGRAWQWETANKVLIKKNAAFKSLKTFLVDADTRGAIVRQEAASMLPPLFLDLEPHHVVLDMCAAPGSKTSQMIDIMTSRSLESGGSLDVPGVIVANEIEPRRASMLCHQLQRFGSALTMVTCWDAATFPNFVLKDASNCPSQSPLLEFDRILADAPCSGDATLRKSPDIWRSWKLNGGLGLHFKQVSILCRGLEMLKVGGRLVYSTCSFNPIENEAVVAEALRRFPLEIEVVSVPPPPGLKLVNGLSEWSLPDPDSTAGDLRLYNSAEEMPSGTTLKFKGTASMWPPTPEETSIRNSLQHCMRLLPHHNNSSGFFVTVLTRVAPKSRGPAPLTNRSPEAIKSDSPTPLSEKSPLTTSSLPEEQDETPSLPNEVCTAATEVNESTEESKENVEEAAAAAPPLKRQKRAGKRASDRDPTGQLTHDFQPCDAEEAKDLMDFYGLGTISNSQDTKSRQEMTFDTLDPRAVFEPRTVLWKTVPSSQGLSPTRIIHRNHTDKKLHLMSEPQRFILEKTSFPACFKWVSIGVSIARKMEKSRRELTEACDWRLTQEGVAAVAPYLRRRVIFIGVEVARVLLMGERRLTSLELQSAAQHGEIFHLVSCRSEDTGALVSGGVVAFIIPPPVAQFCRNVVKQAGQPGNADRVSVVRKPSTLETAGSPEFWETGTLDDAIPIACFLTMSGCLLPYIRKVDTADVMLHLFGKESSPEDNTSPTVITAQDPSSDTEIHKED